MAKAMAPRRHPRQPTSTDKNDEGRGSFSPFFFLTKSALRYFFGSYFLITAIASLSIFTPALEAAIESKLRGSGLDGLLPKALFYNILSAKH